MRPETLTASQRARLIRRERQAQRQLLEAYGHAIGQVQIELKALAGLIETAQGRSDPARWIAKQAELQAWLDLARAQLGTYVLQAERIINGLTDDAALQAQTDGPVLIRAAMGAAPGFVELAAQFRPVPPEVVDRLGRNAAHGTPLGDLLGKAAGESVDRARSELLAQVARGKGPREIARKIRPALNVTAQRSLLIARTESIRAYRQVTQATFHANRDTVTGWYWQATFDTRTCPACWAMSGQTFSTDQGLDSHPGCRCTMVPTTKSWADLGFEGIPDTRPPIRQGTQVFDQLTAGEQRQVLGPAKYEAYRTGQIGLHDLVKRTRHPEWGPGRREASLREALAA